jgi:predicted RNase H-like nuclease (RuvC/YqgF family)
MLDFVTRPLRVLLGTTGSEVVESVRETRDIEKDTLGAVTAIEKATVSLEKHVEVIETLATSVDPLRASVDRLTDTMQELIAVLGPLASAEHEAQKVGRVFHRHRDEPATPPADAAPTPSADAQSSAAGDAPPTPPADTQS